MLSVHDRLKKNAEVIVGANVSGRYEQLYRLVYIQYEWARFMLEGMRRSKPYSAEIAYWMYNDCWPALGYAVVDYYGNPKSVWYATKYSGCPIAATVKCSGNDLEFIVLNDSLESKTLTYKIKAYRPEMEIVELNVGTVHSQANVNVCAATISQNEIDIETSVIFFELYDGETLVSRARWYKRWLTDLNLSRAKLTVDLDKSAQIITVTCNSGIALGVAFDGKFTAEDNFIDLLEGETRTICLNPRDVFDGITVYCYNAPKLTVK